MISKESSAQNPTGQHRSELPEERTTKLVEESQRTMSGLDIEFDPREQEVLDQDNQRHQGVDPRGDDFLESEAQRLKKIADKLEEDQKATNPE